MNSLELIASWKELLRCSDEQINNVIFWAQHRYKHYQIPKRNGGSRDIYHPSPEIKVIQRWIAANIISTLPVHDCVFSYRKKINIRDHAEQHANGNYFLRLDFKDFFPSISEQQVTNYLFQKVHAKRLDLDFAGAALVARLLCRRDKATGSTALSIGAPSSPPVTNALLYNFDHIVDIAARARGCKYTRYADDLYFSTQQPDVLRGFEHEVSHLVERLLPKQRLNIEKTAHVSRKARVIVTGLTVTSERSVSVGRNMKRKIRTEIHLFLHNHLAPEQIGRLKGLVSYVRDIEPQFLDRLSAKFGPEAVEKLMRM